MKENNVYYRMFTWLAVGLLITFVSGYSLSLNEDLLYSVLKVGTIPIIIIELFIAIFLGIRIKKMNPITTKICYIVYSITTGITFGVIFLEYKLASIILIFLTTAVLFGILSLYGYITKRDLTKLSTILVVGLISILIVSILNIFIFRSSSLEVILSILSIIIFLGFIAYDMHNVRYLMNTIDEEKAAVYGAFQLYLDFINLFIRLLELFGKNKD